MRVDGGAAAEQQVDVVEQHGAGSHAQRGARQARAEIEEALGGVRIAVAIAVREIPQHVAAVAIAGVDHEPRAIAQPVARGHLLVRDRAVERARERREIEAAPQPGVDGEIGVAVALVHERARPQHHRHARAP